MEKIKLAVLISGRGSNLKSLIAACQDPNYPAEIAIVVSNEANASGLRHAKTAGLPIKIIDHRSFPNRTQFDQHITDPLTAARVELICLAGFMRVLSEGFVKHWWNKAINIHPSLLPAFKGLNVHSRAIQAGAKFSGCTVHFVRQKMDEGPIICQSVVSIHATDGSRSLAKRILDQELIIYPNVVRWIATGKVSIDNEQVNIDEGASPSVALINPLPR